VVTCDWLPVPTKPSPLDEDIACSRAVAAVGHARGVPQQIVESRYVELFQFFTGDRLNRDGYILQVLLAAVGGDDHLGQFLACRHLRRKRRRGGSRQDADGLGCQILEPESRALEQPSERLAYRESRGHGVRSVVRYDLRDIHELQVGLLRKGGERLRERLRGYLGGEHGGYRRLGLRGWDIGERRWRVAAESPERLSHYGCNLRRWAMQANPRALPI
jgi:hypothetical protein